MMNAALFSGWRNLSKALWLPPVLAIMLASAVYIADPLALRNLRHAVFDQYQRWSPRGQSDSPVRIIDIDEQSLARLGQWPWPRILLAQLLDKLQDGQPKAVAFDIVFAEPDRTTPKSMLKLWRAGDEISAKLADLPDHDSVFADSLRQSRAILGFVAGGDGGPNTIPRQNARFVSMGGTPAAPRFTKALTALPIFEQAAAGNGALNFMPNADGVVRQAPMIVQVGDTLLPSLAAEALREYQGVANYITQDSKLAGGMEEIRIGKLLIPTGGQGDIWLHYSLPVPKRYIPAWEILSGDTPRQTLAGKILLVGSSAPGLGDKHFNPFGAMLPGVEIHAQLLEQILGGSFLYRPGWAPALELLIIVAGGLTVGLKALSKPVIDSSLLTFALLAALGAGGWLAFNLLGWLLDPLTPSLAMVLTYIASVSTNHYASEKRQNRLKQAFSHYVSPNRVDHILRDPAMLQLGGQRRHCSFIFTDLTGYTALLETIDPADAVSWLNGYLDGMIAIAFKYHGTLDRIVGDAVAILFSAPLPQTDYRLRALLCALEMQEFARQYQLRLQNQGVDFGSTRMSVHCGEVIVGNFGGDAMFDYRALGDPVNTAARLERANKYLGTNLCVSETVIADCPDIPVRPIGRLVLKGKKQPLLVYQPLPADAAEDAEYNEAYRLMTERNPLARAAFSRLARTRPWDKLAEMHYRRLEAGESGDLIVMENK